MTTVYLCQTSPEGGASGPATAHETEAEAEAAAVEALRGARYAVVWSVELEEGE